MQHNQHHNHHPRTEWDGGPLAPFAQAARNAAIAGRPPFEFCAASDYERAEAALSIPAEKGE